MKIYVNFEIPETLKEFIEVFYSQRPLEGYHAQLRSPVTYFDKECTKVQSDKSWRSFDDLLLIFQTYYPETTPEIALEHLLKIDLKAGEKKMFPHLGNCGDMGRNRFIPYNQLANWSNDDLNMKMPNSKNSWKELLKMININNEKEFLEYIK